MVSMEEALKKMEEQAKKKRKPHPATHFAGSPLASPSRRAESSKELESGAGQPKGKKTRREPIDVDIKPLSINLPPHSSL